MSARKKSAQSANPTPAQLYDAVYWEMFRVESGRPNAELCLAVTLLRAWMALDEMPAGSEPRQWLRNVSPVCMEMLQSLSDQRNEDSNSCGVDPVA